MLAGRQKFLPFLEGYIRNQDAIYACFFAFCGKSVCSVGEHHVGVGGYHNGGGQLLTELLHQHKYRIGGHTVFQCPNVGLLNDGVGGCGVGEGNVQLQNVGTACHSGLCNGDGGLQIRVTAGDKGHQCLLLRKGIMKITHKAPPLCNGRWRRSPCHRGRRPLQQSLDPCPWWVPAFWRRQWRGRIRWQE